MSSLFNTPFEASIRALLVLYTVNPHGISADRVAIYDFMTLYANDFGITDFNLHGKNDYNFSEFPYKRSLISKGLKEATLDGMIAINKTHSGFEYQINQTGISYVKSLNTDYSHQYLDTAKKVHDAFSSKNDMELMMEINHLAIKALRR